MRPEGATRFLVYGLEPVVPSGRTICYGLLFCYLATFMLLLPTLTTYTPLALTGKATESV